MKSMKRSVSNRLKFSEPGRDTVPARFAFALTQVRPFSIFRA